MLVHTAQVRGRKIAWDKREVVQHGLNADTVQLDLDAEWRECDRIQAVLAGAGGPVRILVDGGRFGIPSALMDAPGAIRMCLMGHVGDTVRIVTAKEAAPLVVVESGEVAGTDPAPEQPDLWAQLMEEVKRATDGANAAAQSATKAESDLRAAAGRGDFDGKDGAPGKTPVRGVDYWTAEDRKPIEDATLAATTAAGRADAAAKTATEGEASRVAAEAERVKAETARAKSEQARETAEAGRVEAERGRVTADAERGKRVDASVQKADAATARATEAAGRAEASATEADAAAKRADEAAKGAGENILVGTKTATVVHVEDAWPTLLRECKVLGKSVQEGTPTPDAPKPITSVGKAEVLVRGRNLVDVPDQVFPAYNNAITDQSVLDEFDRLPRYTPLVFSCIVEPLGPGAGEVGLYDKDDGGGLVHLGTLRNNCIPLTIKRGKVKQINFVGGINQSGRRTVGNIQVAAAKLKYEAPTRLSATQIDLQGHELRSLPNGVRDEVVVDREGNVSLVQRVERTSTAATDGISAEVGSTAMSSTGQLADGAEVIYQLAEPQTIPLGKVEVPRLPESTSNVWNADAITTDVSATYVRDVTLAFDALESKLAETASAIPALAAATL